MLWKANDQRVPKIDELPVNQVIVIPPVEDLDPAYIDPPRVRSALGGMNRETAWCEGRDIGSGGRATRVAPDDEDGPVIEVCFDPWHPDEPFRSDRCGTRATHRGYRSPRRRGSRQVGDETHDDGTETHYRTAPRLCPRQPAGLQGSPL